MKTVIHPYKEISLNAAQYIAEFGGKHDTQWADKRRPATRCPACYAPMKLVGEDRPVHDQFFSHIGNSSEQPVFCPLRTSTTDFRYAFLRDPPHNPTAGEAIKRSFFKNWTKHFSMIRKHLDGMFDVQQFIQLIHIGNESRLWNRGNLSEWEIPYIFLVWQDYPPIKDKRTGKYVRREWYKFWFDYRVRTLEDIWIRTQGKPRIIRATYSIPRDGSSPGIDQLRDTKVFDLNENFLLSNYEPKVHDYVKKCMAREFPNFIP